jgi:hypothetical protein
VNRRFAHMIGLAVLLAPVVAQAQTNLDQGKSPSQIFAAACAECHKASRGLANGKSASALAEFLREHYTTSRDQAAALAAYVLTGRNTDPGAVGARGQERGQERGQDRNQDQKPTTERGATADRGTAATEEAKPSEAKPPKRQARQPKPDEAPPPEAKVEPKPDTDIMSTEQPSSPRARRRDQKPQVQPAAAAPVGIAHAPAAAEPEPARAPAVMPAREVSPPPPPPETPAPTAGASGDEPVPRDNIPD